MTTKTPSRKTPTKTGTKSFAGAKKPAISAVASIRPTPTPGRRPPKIVAQVPQTPSRPRAGTSKQARLIELLRSTTGGSIAQLMAQTGWQAHTVRGTISGVLRKRFGLTVECSAGSSGTRVYRIISATA